MSRADEPITRGELRDIIEQVDAVLGRAQTPALQDPAVRMLFAALRMIAARLDS